MIDPEIRLNILREENELHIFIDHLSNMTPHEVADMVEDIAGILRTLPKKPFKYMSTDDPELMEDNASSPGANSRQHVTKHFWN